MGNYYQPRKSEGERKSATIMARHSFDSIEHLKQWAQTTCPVRRLLSLASIAFRGFFALISTVLLHIPDTNF
jgi:hypothetical protein